MTTTSDPEVLSQKPLFHRLTPEQLAHIKSLLHHKTFPAGATIITVE